MMLCIVTLRHPHHLDFYVPYKCLLLSCVLVVISLLSVYYPSVVQSKNNFLSIHHTKEKAVSRCTCL